ncbi:MAG: hypothetical protein J6E43_01695 [Prevotella sp.]|nr:hypothetical protein [Prevotella sp.]
MKQIVCMLALLGSLVFQGHAQTTPAVTVYKEFRPATIHLADGRLLKVSLANIFLKNSSLLYKSGVDTKEANLKTLTQVDFEDRSYYKIDSLLAYQVDTIGNDALYCAQKIDFVAWRQMVANNSVLSSLDLGDMIGYSYAELADEQDLHFPIIRLYFFRLNGKFVLAHERNLKRVLNKEKRRLMESMMIDKSFSWTDEQSLLKLLKTIQ